MSTIALAVCITHTSACEHPTHLAPFAVCQAFPGSDYYGASVALGLWPFRRSRVPHAVDEKDGLGASFVPLPPLEAGLPPRSVLTRHHANRVYFGSPGCQPLYPGRDLYRSGTEVQAIQPSPCHPGLAGHAPKRFQGTSAFLTCCFPPRLSAVELGYTSTRLVR